MSRFAPPRVVLGTRSLSGLSLATRDRILDVSERYRSPEALAVTLSRALEAGAEGVLGSASSLLAEASAILRRPVPLHVVVPSLNEQDRLELEPGIEPVLQRRLGRGGVRAALARFTRPASLYGGDWAIRLPVLIESELARTRPRDVRGLVLDAWLADCALAAGNRRFFEIFLRLARSRFRAAAGIETHNLGTLAARLAEWGLAPDYIVAPVNPMGLGMKPSLDEALAAMKGIAPVLAKELCAGGVDFEEGAAFARSHGAAGLVADLCELEDAGFELKAVS
jgi:hypothetical protein